MACFAFFHRILTRSSTRATYYPKTLGLEFQHSQFCLPLYLVATFYFSISYIVFMVNFLVSAIPYPECGMFSTAFRRSLYGTETNKLLDEIFSLNISRLCWLRNDIIDFPVT